MLSSAKVKKKPHGDAEFSARHYTGPKQIRWFFDDETSTENEAIKRIVNRQTNNRKGVSYWMGAYSELMAYGDGLQEKFCQIITIGGKANILEANNL